MVGSSTVYPFTKAVAEAFHAQDAGRKAPVIESTGTGAGFKQFCAGVGSQFPDIADASRRISKAEFETCQKNSTPAS
ncbi:MAG: substrate-binding domain-containing protein [Sphingomonas sp.]